MLSPAAGKHRYFFKTPPNPGQAMPQIRTSIETSAATEADFDELVELRIAAMRESLERLGRFDAARARERLRSTFSPEHTRFILFQGAKVGFYAVRRSSEGLRLDHLYVHPKVQNHGIGSVIL